MKKNPLLEAFERAAPGVQKIMEHFHMRLEKHSKALIDPSLDDRDTQVIRGQMIEIGLFLNTMDPPTRVAVVEGRRDVMSEKGAGRPDKEGEDE